MRGDVPEGWRSSTLLEVAKIQMGETIIAKDLTGDGIPVFSAGRGLEPWGFTSAARKFFRRGTIVVGARGSLGFPRLPDHDSFISTQTTIAVTPNAGMEPAFIWAALTALDYEKLGARQAVPMLTIDALASARIPVPPLPEQKKIAAILSSVDEAIQATQAVIEQTRRVKEGLLQDLLTRGLPGHTRFKQTEIGEIPESWEVRTLHQVCHGKNAIVDGPFGSNLKTEHYRSTGVPVIQSAMITSGQFSLGTGSYVYVEPAYFDEIRRSSVLGGDIVMAKIGARAGRSAVLPGEHPESVLAGNCLKLSPDQALAKTEFVAAWLTNAYDTGILATITAGNAQPAISISRLRELKMPLPHLSEQRRIVAFLTDASVGLSASESEARALRSIKSGLLQDLLTGKVRVTA